MEDELKLIDQLVDDLENALTRLERRIAMARWDDPDEMRDARHIVYQIQVPDVSRIRELREHLKYATYKEFGTE
jgi:hypothetical protein